MSLQAPEQATGTRFVITIPTLAEVPEPADPAGRGLQTSTTTGSTIGRRRNRS